MTGLTLDADAGEHVGGLVELRHLGHAGTPAPIKLRVLVQEAGIVRKPETRTGTVR
jgi:hypothetical protein